MSPRHRSRRRFAELAAARCVEGAWLDFIPRAVELEEFIRQWLSGRVEDGIAVVLSSLALGAATRARCSTPRS